MGNGSWSVTKTLHSGRPWCVEQKSPWTLSSKNSSFRYREPLKLGKGRKKEPLDYISWNHEFLNLNAHEDVKSYFGLCHVLCLVDFTQFTQVIQSNYESNFIHNKLIEKKTIEEQRYVVVDRLFFNLQWYVVN